MSRQISLFLERIFAVSFRGNCGGFGANAAYCPPADIFRGKGVDGHGNGLALDGNGGSLAHFRALTGNLNALSAAALERRAERGRAVLFDVRRDALWTGVMEVMNQCHLTDRLAPLPPAAAQEAPANASRDSETLAAISANLSRPSLVGNAGHAAASAPPPYMSRGCNVHRMSCACSSF